MTWRYDFTFIMSRSGLNFVSDFLISRGYEIVEKSSDYIILTTQISNLHKTQFRDNITSLMIREEEII